MALRASSSDNRLRLVVEDDGRSIDWGKVAEQGIEAESLTEEQAGDRSELSRLLYLAGFSTVPRANDISGDGAGLAVVAESAEELNGGLEVSSLPGVARAMGGDV